MVIARILGSKKFLEAMIPNILGLLAVWGLEVPENIQPMIIGAMGAASVVLVSVQGFLDLKFGSKSDGTDKIANGG